MSQRLWDFELTSAIASYNLGMICIELGISGEAVVYLDKAGEYYESISDLRKLADVCFYSAVATQDESHISKALSLYQSVDALNMVKIVRQHHALHVESKRDRHKAVSNLIGLSLEFEESRDFELSVYALSNAAMFCLHDGDHERAAKLLESASRYHEEIEQEYYRSVDFLKAKSLYHEQLGNYDDCISNAEQAGELCQRMGLFVEGAECLQLAATAHHKKGQHEVAYQVLTRAFDLGRQGEFR